MKKKLLLVAGLLICVIPGVFAQSKLSGPYQLNGDVSTIKNSVKAFLYHSPFGFMNFNIQCDSVLIKEGRFTFKGFLKEPELIRILVSGPTSKGKTRGSFTETAIFLLPGTITLKAKDSTLTNPTVTGNTLTQEYLDLREHERNVLTQLVDLSKLYDKTDTANHKEKERLALLLAKKRKDFSDDSYKGFILSHPDSYVSIYALNEYAGGQIKFDQFEPLFSGINKRLQNTPTGMILSGRLENAKASLSGKMAPDFTSLDTAGKAVKLSSYKGKYVLLDFWASWCPPCRQECPFLVKAYRNYKNSNFTILSVSSDTKKQAWIKAIKQDQLAWGHVSDLTFPNKVLDLYNVGAIPQNVLIDPDGRIIAKNLRGEALEKKLKEVLVK